MSEKAPEPQLHMISTGMELICVGYTLEEAEAHEEEYYRLRKMKPRTWQRRVKHVPLVTHDRWNDGRWWFNVYKQAAKERAMKERQDARRAAEKAAEEAAEATRKAAKQAAKADVE